jgi:hypothetical protein
MSIARHGEGQMVPVINVPIDMRACFQQPGQGEWLGGKAKYVHSNLYGHDFENSERAEKLITDTLRKLDGLSFEPRFVQEESFENEMEKLKSYYTWYQNKARRADTQKIQRSESTPMSKPEPAPAQLINPSQRSFTFAAPGGNTPSPAPFAGQVNNNPQPFQPPAAVQAWPTPASVAAQGVLVAKERWWFPSGSTPSTPDGSKYTRVVENGAVVAGYAYKLKGGSKEIYRFGEKTPFNAKETVPRQAYILWERNPLP